MELTLFMQGRTSARLGFKTTLLSFVAGSVLASPAIAQAQAEPNGALQDIVVTAQRRSESVQKVPIAVTVVTGESLARSGVVNISQIGALSSSVTFTSGFEARDNSIRIRGIGSDNSSVGVDSSISTVVDGVVLQRPGAAFGDLIDIERIEILRGPQGTLFGKNSVGGVVNVVTKDPTFKGPEGSVSLLAAQDNEFRATAVYSAPISDTLAFRIAALARTQGGIVKNVFDGHKLNGGKDYGARAKLTYRPTDTLEIKLAADYNKLNSTLGASPLYTIGSSAKVPRPLVTVGAKNDEVDNDVDSYARQKNYGASIESNLQLGDFKVTLIDAFRRFRNVSNFDADNTRAPILLQFLNTEKSKTQTHELRLTSPTGKLIDFVAGALYFDGSVSNLLDRRGYAIADIAAGSINQTTGVISPVPTLVPVLGYASVDTKNLGIYGQVNVHPTDKLTITGGARHIYEKNKFFFSRPTAPPLTGGFDYKDNAITGKATIIYQFTPVLMTYAGYSTGYTGKATNSGAALTIAEFNNGPANPMTSAQYEAGVKSQFLDGHLRVNLAAFRTRYKNYQATITRPSDGLRALTNAGTVGIDGVELEVTTVPTRDLSISGGLTYLDARFVDSVANCYPGQTAALGCIIQPAAGSVPAVSYQRLDGKAFLNAPKWRYTISARQQFPLGALVGNVQAGYRWQSRVNFDVSQDPARIQKAYGIADLSVGVATADGSLEFSVFAKNLFDRQYRVGTITFNGTFAGNGPAYAQQIARDFHRYLGASLRYNY